MHDNVVVSTFLIIIFVGFGFMVNGQIDTLHFAQAFELLDEAKQCHRNNPGDPYCTNLLDQAYDESGQHAYFLEEIVAFLIAHQLYNEARKYVYIKRIDILPNSVKARHFHFRGLLELQSGFYYFTRAYQSFREAYYWELRARYPSFKFLSQVQNALGYARMLYGGPNKGSPEDYPHCNWVTSDLISALKHFEQALYFDSENQNAQANKDTLLVKIEEAGKWDSHILQQIRPKPIDLIRYEMALDETNEEDSLDLLNFSILPHNKEILLKTLGFYDELLIVADISGSMEDIHSGKGVSRFALMSELVLFLFHNLAAGTSTGMVTVGGKCFWQPRIFYPTHVNARKEIMNEIKSIGPGGNTPLSYSLNRGKELFSENENNKALFLISDGLENCGAPLDLCVIAGDLHAMGVDLHIISFIVEGMEERELAYEIYACMTRYSEGKIFRYDKDGVSDQSQEPEPLHEEILLLPPITFGDNLHGVFHFEVNLSDYFHKKDSWEPSQDKD